MNASVFLTCFEFIKHLKLCQNKVVIMHILVIKLKYVRMSLVTAPSCDFSELTRVYYVFRPFTTAGRSLPKLVIYKLTWLFLTRLVLVCMVRHNEISILCFTKLLINHCYDYNYDYTSLRKKLMKDSDIQ